MIIILPALSAGYIKSVGRNFVKKTQNSLKKTSFLQFSSFSSLVLKSKAHEENLKKTSFLHRVFFNFHRVKYIAGVFFSFLHSFFEFSSQNSYPYSHNEYISASKYGQLYIIYFFGGNCLNLPTFWVKLDITYGYVRLYNTFIWYITYWENPNWSFLHFWGGFLQFS